MKIRTQKSDIYDVARSSDKDDEVMISEINGEDDEDFNYYSDPQCSQIGLDRLISTLKRNGHMTEIRRPHPPHRLEQVAEPLTSAEAMDEAIKVVSWEQLSNGTLDHAKEWWKLDQYEIDGLSSSKLCCWVRKVYVPCKGDLKLHFSIEGTNQSCDDQSNVYDKTIRSMPNNPNKGGNGRVNTDNRSKEDSRNKVTVKAVSMNGCTLFPGSTEWMKFAISRARRLYLTNMQIELSAAKKAVDETKTELDSLTKRKAQLELQIQNWTREQENLNARTEKSTCYEMDSLLDTVVCGAENVCSSTLKGKLGTRAGIEFQMKCNNSYMIALKESLDSDQQRINAARHIWIAHCIIAARLSEILTDVAVLEMADSALKVEEFGKQAVGVLQEKMQELRAATERSKRNIEICKGNVFRLCKQLQAESERYAGNLGQIQDIPLQIDLQEARIQLEKAHADPLVSAKRISAAKATFQLLGLIKKLDQAYEAAEDALHSKSQARLYSQIVLDRYHEIAELNQLALSVQEHNFDLQRQELSVKSFNTNTSSKTKSNIEAKYKSKITTAEQELKSLTNQDDNEINQSQARASEVKEGKSQAAIRELMYETSTAFERVKAEEALSALWASWSDAADRRFTHRPQDQAIATAFDALLTSRRKIAAVVQLHIIKEEAKGQNVRVPAWLRTEPTLPTELHPYAWWPRKAATLDDSEKTLAALEASADRTVDFFWARLEKIPSVQAPTNRAFQHSVADSRGRLTFIAAKECQERSVQILVALEAAAAILKNPAMR